MDANSITWPFHHQVHGHKRGLLLIKDYYNFTLWDWFHWWTGQLKRDPFGANESELVADWLNNWVTEHPIERKNNGLGGSKVSQPAAAVWRKKKRKKKRRDQGRAGQDRDWRCWVEGDWWCQPHLLAGREAEWNVHVERNKTLVGTC